MIVWCAYCQSYMGEKPPIDNFSLTHGICISCVGKKKKKTFKDDEQHFEKIKNFFNNLMMRSRNAEQLEVTSVLKQAHQLKIKPLDLFFGIVQPILWELGKLQQKGQIPVVKEHIFTAFATALIAELSKDMGVKKGNVDILILCAPNNYHTLGVQALEMELKSRGYLCRSIYPGVPVEEIKGLVANLNPKIIGMSISVDFQLEEVLGFSKWLEKSYPTKKLILGGPYLKDSSHLESLGPNILAFSRLDELYQFLDEILAHKAA